MTLKERIRLYQQLTVLVRAGLSIVASFTRQVEKMPGPEVRRVEEGLKAGERLGEAFEAAGFSPFEYNLVNAGEQSGQLDTVFAHLAEFWARELQMRRAMIRPLIYPLVVFHIALIVGAVVEAVTSTIPEAVVHFVLHLAIFYVACFVIYTLVKVSWSSPLLRRFWLYVPFVGRALRTAYWYRWITVLRLEFGAGISLYRAVGDAWRASGYLNAERRAEEGEQAMMQGAKLSEMVIKWRMLPRDWIDFVETAEISGAFNEGFATLENEAAENWKAARNSMEEWLPKIGYFVLLLAAGAMVFTVMKAALIDPITHIQDTIDNVGK